MFSMPEPFKLDRFDKRILAELQKDGGLTNQHLAERIGLSPSPCSRRVKQLEEAGIIQRRVTLLDRRKLGLSLTAIIQISMDRHTPERFEAFEAKVRQYPEVQECYLITGQDADYLVKVVVPDMDHYQEFLLNKITRIDGVSGVHSSFVMRRVVDSTELPLAYVG
jgi:Lrp/AsnC family leucine-responsive transcriptional regulator